MFDKLKKQVNNALNTASSKIVDTEINKKTLDDILWDLQVSLLQSDVALQTAESICDEIKRSLLGAEVKRTKVKEIIRNSFRQAVEKTLEQDSHDLIKKIKDKDGVTLLLFLGFNGSGKTTTLAKIAKMLKKENMSMVLAAADTYRAASIEQLEKHASNLDLKLIKHGYKSDAAAVVYDAMEHAKSKNMDVVLADTAGRTHSNANLMDELKKICNVNNPDIKILVIDSLTGNDAVDQAKKFEESIGVDGVILTKMDVNDKGGAALSVSHSIDKPILYIGMGQEYGDLEKFVPEEIVKRILS